MRFSLISILFGVSVATVLVWLNTLENLNVSEPYYAPMLGAVPHPPPYDMNEMSISVHADRGWPIWHTRASNHFAAHNVSAYMMDGGLPYDHPIQQTEPVRVLIDLAVGFLISGITLLVCEMIVCFVSRSRSSDFVASSENQD